MTEPEKPVDVSDRAASKPERVVVIFGVTITVAAGASDTVALPYLNARRYSCVSDGLNENDRLRSQSPDVHVIVCAVAQADRERAAERAPAPGAPTSHRRRQAGARPDEDAWLR